MTAPIPPALRRLWRLHLAKRALLGGAPERTLDMLGHPSLALSEKAIHLRECALEELLRSAAQRRAQGRDASAARLVGFVAAQDPLRAREWRRSLGSRAGQSRGGHERLRLRLHASSKGAGEEQGVGDDAHGAHVGQTAAAGESPHAQHPQQDTAATDEGGGRLRFRLAVDDGGDFLVLCSRRISLGHAQAGLADVPLLADLESRHAFMHWTTSFHGGALWLIEPTQRGRVILNGEILAGPSRPLVDGDLLQLGSQVEFRFRLPERSSGSALLELANGMEAEGAAHVALMLPGAAGRMRIGPQRARHIPVAGLEHEVSLILQGSSLCVACDGGIRRIDVEPSVAGGKASVEQWIELPPERRIDLLVNARPSRRLPFGMALLPLTSRPHAGSP